MLTVRHHIHLPIYWQMHSHTLSSVKANPLTCSTSYQLLYVLQDKAPTISPPRPSYAIFFFFSITSSYWNTNHAVISSIKKIQNLFLALLPCKIFPLITKSLQKLVYIHYHHFFSDSFLYSLHWKCSFQDSQWSSCC